MSKESATFESKDCEIAYQVFHTFCDIQIFAGKGDIGWMGDKKIWRGEGGGRGSATDVTSSSKVNIGG